MTIEVKNIKSHKRVIPQHNDFDSTVFVPVAEGKLVLVEDGEASLEAKSIIASLGNVRFGNKFYKPIIISEDEICETGELYLSSIKRDIKPKSKGVIQAGDKILALSEHFSPKQLEMIVEGKLKDGDTVLVECEEDYLSNPKCVSTGKCQETEGFKGTEHEGVDMCEDGCVQGRRAHVVKLNVNDHIGLYSIEPVGESDKKYTREEVENILIEYVRTNPTKPYRPIDWFKKYVQNVEG